MSDELWQAFVQITGSVNALLLGAILILSPRLHRTRARQKLGPALVLLIGRWQLPKGLPWHYDSSALLEGSDIPMAWLLAEKDRSAPNARTIATLQSLIESGKPYSLTLFPDADHGMLTFEELDGQRAYDGYAAGYFQAEVGALRRLANSTPSTED